MVKVTSKIEKLKELEKQIEEAKSKIHSDFGEEIISELEIDYDLLERKKDIREAVQLIISELNKNPFSDKDETLVENIEKNHEDNNYEKQNT